MEKLIFAKNELRKILINFNKSKNRRYTEKTLQEKSERVKSLITESKECLRILGTPEKLETVLQYREIYTQIEALSETIYKLIESQRQTISDMGFDMKEATALVQYFTGKYEETEAFIEAIELLDELTPAEHKNTMIKFIKTRITGKARHTISNEITTIEQIKTKLKEKFSIKISSDAILAKLKTCKQGNRKLEDFTEQIENLSRQLSSAFIAEQVATGEAAEKLAEKFSTQAYIDNVTNSDTAMILKASNLKTLSEIATKALTVDKPQINNVMYYNAGHRRNVDRNHQQNRNRNNYNRGNWQRRQQPNNAWPRQQTNNTWPRPNNAWQQNPRQSNSQSYQNNNHNGYRQNNNNRRVNHYGSGEEQNPQPDTEMSRLGDTTLSNPEYTR